MRAKITIDIEYMLDEPDEETVREVHRMLEYACMHLADEGFLTGPTELEVENWDYDVDVEEE